MDRRLPGLILLIRFLILLPQAEAQCGYPVIIATTKGFCTGNLLHIASSHAFSTIVWYKDGAPVKTANATQSLNTTGIVFAAPPQFGGTDANLASPGSLAFDTAGNLYVCETYQYVKKYPPGGGVGVIAAGVNGKGSGASQLDGPEAIFIDRQNNLYVWDGGNNRIQKFAPGDTAAATVGVVANGVALAGLYVDCAGNIYASDDANSAVIKFFPGSTNPTVVAGGNGAGSAANQLDQPSYVWVDSAGNIFVSDGIAYSAEGNPRVMEWKPGAAAGITVAGGHGYGYGYNQMSYLRWMDGKDNMYIENNNISGANLNIRVDSWPLGASSGTTILGNKGIGNALDQFSAGISGLAEDVKGNVYISDPNFARILEFKRTVLIDTTYTPTDPGQYYAIVTDVQGYTITTPTITVNTPDTNPASITITATATSTTVCTPITFNAAAANAGANPDFQWEVSGVKVGSDSSSYSNNLFANGDRVYCILTSLSSCSIGPGGDTSNIITLDIDPKGAAAVTIAVSDTAICQGAPLTFDASVTNGSVQPTFQWLLNGQPIPGDDTAAYHSDSLANGNIITCLISSDDACGLAKSNSIAIQVSPPPTIAANQVFNIRYGESLTLDPVVTGNIISWLWTPGASLSDSTIADPVAAPATTTDYKLKIVSAGCGADSGYILVNVYTPLSLPNAFTPNGDGHNDIFYVLGGPSGSQIEDFSIFNRWGATVFQAHDATPGDPSRGWNGYIHGQPAPPDTYVYQVVMKYSDGSRQIYKGTVIVIR